MAGAKRASAKMAGEDHFTAFADLIMQPGYSNFRAQFNGNYVPSYSSEEYNEDLRSIADVLNGIDTEVQKRPKQWEQVSFQISF